MIPADQALQRLQDGNRRFSQQVRDGGSRPSEAPRLTQRQRPFATILGCSDARVPAEMVFDQGLGDLFVIRVAGNIVEPSQIGSVEFAAAKLGARLVVVLGHSSCGAILATLEELEHPGNGMSPHLGSIIQKVKPSVEPLLSTDLRNNREELIRQAVIANVRASVDHLQSGSRMLRQMLEDEGLMIVGAEYSLETGEVDFFEVD